jgi:hypothetical protein
MQPERQHSLVMSAIRQEAPIRHARTARVDATSTAHPFHTIVPINHHKHINVNAIESCRCISPTSASQTVKLSHSEPRRDAMNDSRVLRILIHTRPLSKFAAH